MILKVHLQGAASYDVGDEIWQESLADAIHAEAETIAGYAGSDLLESLGREPTLDEIGPHNREISLASLKKGRGRSKAGKPGTHAYKGKSR